jgi:hypothetical protein
VLPLERHRVLQAERVTARQVHGPPDRWGRLVDVRAHRALAPAVFCAHGDWERARVFVLWLARLLPIQIQNTLRH